MESTAYAHKQREAGRTKYISKKKIYYRPETMHQAAKINVF
jgi:hypothetical protein